ncbi:hypothetical protein H4R18_004998 [Coemansia javaensis]|uniref:Uncharacterized protein n=1 Tax=Coemansia javaensis TaxID=2761396 RepID=A0A9W8H3B4_9FUNG|nr:hypothetical protein H4R18_004998 [Coemansia javaensis]
MHRDLPRLGSPPPARPLSQLNFRLSQRPPPAQRAFRRQISRTESIEDGSSGESVAADAPIDDYASSDDGRHGLPGGRPEPPTPLTVSSPALTLGPLRTISIHRQHLSPQSAPAGRPLLSQRPSPPRRALGPDGAAQPGQAADPAPAKRPRRLGPAAAEVLEAAARDASEFRVWQHCLGSGPGAQLVCNRPQPGLRLRLHAVQCVVEPHLFSAQAEVLELLEASADSGQPAPGAPLVALLSLAVCQDAAPHAAAQLARRLRAPGAGPVVAAVYRPWRMQAGDAPCLLASRFQLE